MARLAAAEAAAVLWADLSAVVMARHHGISGFRSTNTRGLARPKNIKISTNLSFNSITMVYNEVQNTIIELYFLECNIAKLLIIPYNNNLTFF